MATKGITLWSTTALSNGSADPAVNYLEGQAPSSLNDAGRGAMASIANWRNDLYGITTGGSSTAFTATTGSTFNAAADMSGCVFSIIPHATSGASPTLAVDGLTARAINESTGVAVATGALILGTPYLVKYVHATTEFILLGRSPVFNTLTAKTNIIAAPGTTAGRPSAVSGGFRFNTDTALPEFSDGANWFSLITTLAGAQTPYGAVINGTIVESHTGNAVTFALKTLAGTDPSASDPVLLAFRNSTVATGNYVYRTVTAALSLTLSSGSKIGAVDTVPFKVWIVLFDDGGTIKLGAINCVSGSNIYPLGQVPLASTTADDNLGGSDAAQTFYSKNGVAAVSSKAYVIVAYASYESGLSTAGSWAASPTRIQLYGAGVPLPGQVVQTATALTTSNTTNVTATYTATASTVSISPISAANLVNVRCASSIGQNGSTDAGIVQFRRGTSTAFGPEIAMKNSNNAPGYFPCVVEGWDAPGVTTSTAYTVYLKSSGTTNTAQFPQSTFGAQITAQEVMT
jgi:hypothetical protein